MYWRYNKSTGHQQKKPSSPLSTYLFRNTQTSFGGPKAIRVIRAKRAPQDLKEKRALKAIPALKALKVIPVLKALKAIPVLKALRALRVPPTLEQLHRRD